VAVHRCNRQAVDLLAAAPRGVVHREVDPPVAVHRVVARRVVVRRAVDPPVAVHREAVLRVVVPPAVVRLEVDRPAADLPVAAACPVAHPVVVPLVHPVVRWAARQAA